MSKILVIGGGGYVGSALCPALIKEGHKVVAYDTFWYGQHVLPHTVIKVVGDMRNTAHLKEALHGYDTVVHLACISNDPSFDLNPALGKSINLDCFPAVCEAVREAGVKRFIYASSSSVYGVQEGEVTEQTDCAPLTDYSRFKLACEEHLRSADMGTTQWTILRPATVCGAAPRLRLDLIVNILTVSALTNRKITVQGGEQLRPNLNINDMVNAYVRVITAPAYKAHGETFNVGDLNVSVANLANKIARFVDDPGITIETVPSADARSYHINSDYIKRKLSFTLKHSIKDAVESIKQVHPYLIRPLDNPQWHNIKRMKELGL